ncbi:hypothetical protein [Clostridium beijerinckii]|uniref:hypothetical protein n=1 Tax=Clostridium beijerinckii TaxID=1520 RepID=UPI00098C13AA|nr:hypothetical protein [Clostridium beijerinckii]MBA8934343.1 hypothetical protein [Clostridium beijerinckii]NRT35772.1 hypothetical protein [Clostridium beijerinckii]NRT44802.1 hypothetical protein [Clostridium beijerinckii]NRU38531.1 hypothetical protein [Clostridium beijerinckii]NRZ21206.1 hypothetical protein [Clostridium beijerinckii]
MEIRNFVALNGTIMPASLFDDSDDAHRYNHKVVASGVIGADCFSDENGKMDGTKIMLHSGSA